MDARSLTFLAEACGGELHDVDGQIEVTSICTDSRAIKPASLFVALRGDRFDGHDFAVQALQQGSRAVVIEKSSVLAVSPGMPRILVEDARQALGKMAARYRQDFDLPVVCVAGSNGKTTTKDLLGAILKQHAPAVVSAASFNNDVGVPVTLLELSRQTIHAVLEVGTNHPGELKPLVAMARPDIGVITSVGREHLEFFKDIAGVVQEEGILAEMLPDDGILIVNGDQPVMEQVEKRSKARRVRCGFEPRTDWRSQLLEMGISGTRFHVHAPKKEFQGEYKIGLVGRHQVVNALLALSVAAELGIPAETARQALANCGPAKMRLQLREEEGILFVDDCYNANADSALAALQTLEDLPGRARKWVVFGEMAELGDHALAAHAEVGKKIGTMHVAGLFVLGAAAKATAVEARKAGLGFVEEHEETGTVAQRLRELLQPGDVVLLKASRAARLERVTEAWQRSKMQ